MHNSYCGIAYRENRFGWNCRGRTCSTTVRVKLPRENMQYQRQLLLVKTSQGECAILESAIVRMELLRENM